MEYPFTATLFSCLAFFPDVTPWEDGVGNKRPRLWTQKKRWVRWRNRGDGAVMAMIPIGWGGRHAGPTLGTGLRTANGTHESRASLILVLGKKSRDTECPLFFGPQTTRHGPCTHQDILSALHATRSDRHANWWRSLKNEGWSTNMASLRFLGSSP